jgi:hypothetical protein
MFEVRWRPERERMSTVFDHFITEALAGGEASARDSAHTLVREFVSATDVAIRCNYRVDEAALYVNGRLICKGVPAAILRNCLRATCATGRTKFTFREFKRERELVSHPKNTGFEVRLRRLRETLDAAQCGLRIEPTARGCFALRTQGHVTLHESVSSAPAEITPRLNNDESRPL